MKYSTTIVLVTALLLLHASCKGQQPTQAPTLAGDTVTQIGSYIRCIYQDADNAYWFATDGEGLYRYDGHNAVQYTTRHGLCSDNVWNVLRGNDGKLYVQTRDGVCNFNGSAFATMAVVQGSGMYIDSNAATTLQYPTHNYQSTMLLGDYSFNGTSLIKINLPHTSPLTNTNPNARFHYDVYATYKNKQGKVWFGTCTAGVCIFDGSTYQWLNNEELGAPVRCIFEDRQGNIWIGNNGYGLLKYDGQKLVNITQQHGLDNPGFRQKMDGKEGTLARVWSIADDKDGNLWIGTIDAGVWKYDGTQLTNYTAKDGLGSDIWTIYRDRNDKLWFGTDGGGVYTFDGKRFNKFKP